MCWECSRSRVLGSWIVLTAPLCPQDLLLHNRQAAEQSLCLCCPEPGERGTGVPCLPLTQEEDCKHLPSALGSARYGWEQGPAFFPFSIEGHCLCEPQLDLEPGSKCACVLQRQRVSKGGFPIPAPEGLLFRVAGPQRQTDTELSSGLPSVCSTENGSKGCWGSLRFHGSGVILD